MRLRGAVALAAALLGVAAPSAAAQSSRYDVLVFSKTTGFRHTDSIAAGRTGIQAMGAEKNFNVTLSEDSSLFTDAALRDFEVVVMLNTDGENILNAAQRTAFERWYQRGKGLVGIHASANADRNWEWMNEARGGSLFANHPSGALQFQQATVNVVEPNHPSTQGIPANWVRTDEWYNFTQEPVGVKTLAKLDESTYEEQDGSAEADDHPIAWCSNYDRGRSFYTALGHNGSAWQEPDFQKHIVGAIEWASGLVPGDCGAPREGIPTDASFDKVTLDDNTENPMEIAIAPGGNVYYVELAGKVKYYNAATGAVRVVGTIPVHRGNENGLLGIALDPNFATNKWMYLFYSAPSPEEQHVSRFTVKEDGTLDMASEKVLLKIPHQRIVCCHSAGSMTFGPGGLLHISTGDDTEHAASQGYNPIDDDNLRNNPGDNPDADRAYDARRTSGNTNDLRGKILRIKPEPDGTYSIPNGNLFPPGISDPLKTKPEIYTMGHRNPFRIQVDQETGWVYNGEVGPDAGGENANRGPRGYDELNQIRQAGNMGWPYCIADNKAYRDWNFTTQVAGETFDCAGGPNNTSAYNTGLAKTPGATGALLWWPYSSGDGYPTNIPGGFPWANAPTRIPPGSGRTAIAGPIYHYNAEAGADTRLPAFYDDQVIFADWSRDWIATMRLNAEGKPAEIREFMPNADFRHPQDIEMGPDGRLYVLEWGRDFNYAGSGINPDSGLYRIDYVKGSRTPLAKASADKDSGVSPLTVTFSSAGSEDPDGDALTYEWDFGDGSAKSTQANPAHTFTTSGTFTVQLKVTDTSGKSSSSSVVVTVGNTRPTVTLDLPQGGVYGWGDEIAYKVTVTDPEDANIDCSKVVVSPGIFHDEGGNAHVHPGVNKTGCEGTIQVEQESGHEKSANIALVLTATYLDNGAPGSQPLEGATTRRLNPKEIQAEHYTGQSGVAAVDSTSADGGRRVGGLDVGDSFFFEPVSLKNINKVTVRYASAGAGGLAEFRLDSPTGPLVGTADLTASGGAGVYKTASATLTLPDANDHKLYVVVAARSGGPTTALYEIDSMTFSGKGVASNAAPEVSVTADSTSGVAPFPVSFTGNVLDPEGGALTYAWDFDSNGTTDATTKDATHVYTAIGTYTATLTATDAGGKHQKATIRIDATSAVASCPGDDDFLGTSLNTSRWTVTREDPTAMNVSGGSLNITSQNFDIHGGGTGLRNIVHQPLPTSGPWTATIKANWDPTTNYNNAGLMVYGDDANFIKAGMVWSGGRRFEAFKELTNTPTALGSATGVLAASFPTTWYLRLTSNGTTIQPAYSADGITWTNYGATTNLTGITAPKIGVYATSASSVNRDFKVDWFKLTTPQTPSDEFDGSTLNLCRWNSIVRHEPGGYTVADGKLTLPAAHGDFFGNGANNNPNMLLQQPAPSGPWTMETRLTFNPNENYEQAGLLVYSDDQNYVKADYVYASGRALEFLNEVNGATGGFDNTVNINSRPTTVNLRIVSDGTTLRAWYRFDGDANWARFGTDTPLSAAGPSPKLGIYANDSNATVTTRDNAVFDYVRITAGAPDEQAPTTTSSVAPAAPDGANGWYKSDAVLTLATESGATTQYKLGTGAYQAYSAPVTLPEGTTTVTYRSTDAAGNVEAEKTVTVKVDKTAPSSSVALNPATPGAGGTYTGPVSVTVSGTDSAGGSGLDKLEYRLDGGAWSPYTAPVSVSGNGAHTLEHRATDQAGNVGTVGSVAFTIAPSGGGQSVDEDVQLSGDVPGVLSLSIATPPTFGTFAPGVTQLYTAQALATVTSSAENATLSVHDPGTTHAGKLVNGQFALPRAVQVKATSARGTGGGAFAPIGSTPTTLLNYAGPVGKDTATIDFQQSINETDELRRGTYAKTLTFTLSTTTP
ncbi:ThuA domain-containing protein [Solirubrobacter sp. CPCC 204708]|uniref:ThuA domain-containing protein n=1 Tax=Solirubrobacter deserti TaxID=2282478 RepID=A0ABT4RTB6_9ACTN|nr:ThuA domain-containing protein [Solirubrobacter deserti]MBE2320370.1 ThuA domain-containing protein [Solirubrobacter deserti]MDA0141722.1 ThuA domain-containing protein [Solirubrobacter deserti]